MASPRFLQGESLEKFNEGIGYILNRWKALRTVVAYQWGGDNSTLKAENLIADVRSWFAQSKEPLNIHDLKTLINEGMDVAFDLRIRDGSDGDMAAELMILHEECLDGDFRTIKLLEEDSRTPNFNRLVDEIFGFCPEEFEGGNNQSNESIIEDGTWGNMDVDIAQPESSSDSVNKPN